MVFKVYSRDKLANQRLSELRFETFSKQELWLKAFVLFKSLSPVCRSWLFQISHGKYQRVSCASKEQGSLRGRRVKFQFLSVSAMASQRAAEQCREGGGTFWSTQQGNTLVFFQNNPSPLCQAVPTLTGCPTLQDPPLLSRHWPCSAHLFQDLPHQVYKSLWVITLFWPCL